MNYVKIRVMILMTALPALMVLFAAGNARADKKVKWVKSPTGVSSLMTLSKDMGKMKRQLKKETRDYDDIKEAIVGLDLKKGEASDDIERRYGSPAITLREADGGGVKWVYKPASSSYFEGEKAYLFFDGEGRLVKWEIVEQDNKKRSVLYSGPAEDPR